MLLGQMSASLVLLHLILQDFAGFSVLLQHAQFGGRYQMFVFDEEPDHFGKELTNIGVAFRVLVVQTILLSLFFVIKVVVSLVLCFLSKFPQHVHRQRFVRFHRLQVVDDENGRQAVAVDLEFSKQILIRSLGHASNDDSVSVGRKIQNKLQKETKMCMIRQKTA